MAASAATLAALGTRVGWETPLHWALPVAVDVLALVAGVAWLAAGVADAARSLGRTLTLVSVVVSVVLNAIGHLVSTGHMTVGPILVIGVSAVPPLAAALAVHLTAAITTAAPAEPVTVADPVGDTTVVPPLSPALSTPVPPAAVPAAALPVVAEESQVGSVDTEPVPGDTAPVAEPVEGDTEPVPAAAVRLSTEDARRAIEDGWTRGDTIRVTAAAATRSGSYVGRVFAELERDKGPQPIAGQLALVGNRSA
jgi:hypothetical protein